MEKTIHISETAGIARDREYVRVSVPWARGELWADADLAVVGPAGQVLPFQRRVLKQWPDGSVKWLLVDFAASVPPTAPPTGSWWPKMTHCRTRQRFRLKKDTTPGRSIPEAVFFISTSARSDPLRRYGARVVTSLRQAGGLSALPRWCGSLPFAD